MRESDEGDEDARRCACLNVVKTSPVRPHCDRPMVAEKDERPDPVAELDGELETVADEGLLGSMLTTR